MKVCFVVPDGVGIRNYLFSPLIGFLKNQGVSLSIWHKLDNDVIRSIEELHGVNLESIPLSCDSEPTFGSLFKEAAVYSRLKRNALLDSNPATLLDWNFSNKSIQRKVFLRFAELIGKTLTSYESILFAENYYYNKLRSTPGFHSAVASLKASRPNLLFCTHQRSPDAALAIEAAKYLKIPTATVIYSWDNLPKARLLVKSDLFIVWSDYMKSEMKKYYPEISEDRVFNLGTPQFDFHNDPSNIINRVEFASKYGLNPEKKWICFSGDDQMTSPYDPLYLRDFAEITEKMEDVELIFRPVPVSSHERYQQVISKFPHIKVISPKWNRSGMWSYAYPNFEDVSILSSISFHCQAVVNVGSTMALDFACFDNPGIYLNYSPEGGDVKKWVPSMIYDRQHFRTMNGRDAVVWINSKEDIRGIILKIMENPKLVAKDRIAWLDTVRKNNGDEGACSLIARFITNRV